jgi:hypothetical protein
LTHSELALQRLRGNFYYFPIGSGQKIEQNKKSTVQEDRNTPDHRKKQSKIMQHFIPLSISCSDNPNSHLYLLLVSQNHVADDFDGVLRNPDRVMFGIFADLLDRAAIYPVSHCIFGGLC